MFVQLPILIRLRAVVVRDAHKERARIRIAIFVIKQAVREADLYFVLVEVGAETAKKDEEMRGVKARRGGQGFLGAGVVKRQHSTLRRLGGRCARARVMSRSFPRSGALGASTARCPSDRRGR